ncbi:hypothetical protein GCM10027396_16200 [Insolitispirillum peregrinum]
MANPPIASANNTSPGDSGAEGWDAMSGLLKSERGRYMSANLLQCKRRSPDEGDRFARGGCITPLLTTPAI